MSADSARRWARIGGLLYLIIIVAGIAGELLVRGSIVVPGDAASTAANLAAAKPLWRAGIAGDLLMHVCDLPLILILYLLLRPVNRILALLAVLFNLVQTAVLVANKLTLVLPLILLGDAAYLRAFTPQQLQALAYVPLRLHNFGFGFGLIFFGLECLVLGYLLYRSRYFPRFLGVLMAVAGVCYIVNSYALILSPPLASTLFPAIMLPPFIAELALALWLLLRGVNRIEWESQAVAGAQLDLQHTSGHRGM